MGVCVGTELIEKTIRQVKNNLVGRYADAGGASKILLKIIELAGDGNYLEFGVLHGGSLCAVALLKKALGHKGICIGVDLFDGWYFQSSGKLTDKTGVSVGINTVTKNINRFNINNAELVQSNTHDYQTDNKFVVTFVDAGHTEEGCWKDWLIVKDITTGYVVFHDYQLIEGVTAVCDKAALDKEWTAIEKGRGVFVLKRDT
jgi:hypothetical protein